MTRPPPTDFRSAAMLSGRIRLSARDTKKKPRRNIISEGFIFPVKVQHDKAEHKETVSNELFSSLFSSFFLNFALSLG